MIAAFLFAAGPASAGEATAVPALLAGVSAGAAVESTSLRATPRFRLGAAADVLLAGGLTLAARVELTHVLDGSAALLAGWYGPGLSAPEGLPLGLLVGGAAGVTHEGSGALGGRATAVLGLWQDRAALELDTTIRWPLRGGARAPDWVLGLALRVVPWVLP
ncbi:MAG: hypothetical protein IT384_07440 [Deltaproteobacteria bacterium]|nr:hypothetical protein [Deltaproteobacteria bacterium]